MNLSRSPLGVWAVAAWIAAVPAGIGLGICDDAPPKPGLTVAADGRLLREGKPFRGIGVNYYDAFVRSLAPGTSRDIEPGFRALARLGIPFVRFSAGGYWPVDWGLYRTNAAAHWERLDHVVRVAERTGVGLVPSLFWNPPTLSDIVGEPLEAWGRDSGDTVRFMRAYTREVVTRYRESSAIWAWEFGNEFNLGADLPNAAEHRPPTPPGTGTPATRTARDDLRHADFRHALREFAKEVRRHDAHRPVLSGNAFPRPSAWHQMHSGTWDRDTPSQWVEMLRGDNPEPMDAFSGRLYSDEDLGLLDWASETARSSRRPLFVGEFGVTGPPTDAALDRLRGMLDALESRGVPLAALWVYDFDGQRATWNVTTENERSRILSLVAERQAAWAGKEGSGRGVDGAAGAGATVEGGAKRVP